MNARYLGLDSDGLVREREIQRECAADSGRTVDMNFSAQEACQFATDREAQSSAAVLAARRAVSLLKRLENHLLLVLRDSDAGINDREGDYLVCIVQLRVPGRPSGQGDGHTKRHLAPLGKLESVRQQVLQNLLETLFVGVNNGRQRRVSLNDKIQSLALRDLVESALDIVMQFGEAFGGNIQRDRSRFDFCEVENIVDERKQVRACRVDCLRKVDLFRCEIVVGVVGQ